MLAPAALDRAQRESLLGRASPLVKLGVATVWLIGLATTVDARAGVFLAIAALLSACKNRGRDGRRDMASRKSFSCTSIVPSSSSAE